MRDRDTLVGQRGMVGVHSQSVFTLQIGDAIYQTYEQGLSAHRRTEWLSGMVAIVGLVLWIVTQVYFGKFSPTQRANAVSTRPII